MTATTPFLNRPLRTEEQARRDCERARELDGIIKGATTGRNPLGALAAYHRPDPARVLADRRATREDRRRRRLSRYAFLLCRELDARELSGKGLHEEERVQLVTALTAIRRSMA